jgi:hypothetical protein
MVSELARVVKKGEDESSATLFCYPYDNPMAHNKNMRKSASSVDQSSSADFTDLRRVGD